MGNISLGIFIGCVCVYGFAKALKSCCNKSVESVKFFNSFGCDFRLMNREYYAESISRTRGNINRYKRNIHRCRCSIIT